MDDVLEFTRNRLAALRTERGISARDMSVSIGQNHAYINKIENGAHKPSLESLDYICGYFGITLSEFFDADSRNPVEVKELIEQAKRLDRESLLHLIEVAKRMDKK